MKQGAVALQAEPQHGALFLGADGLDAAIEVLRHLGDRHAAGQQAYHLVLPGGELHRGGLVQQPGLRQHGVDPGQDRERFLSRA